MIRGKIIDAEKALRTGARTLGVPPLVPSSWELVRRSQTGRDEVVANNVAAYGIDSDGTVAYSNGRGIFSLAGPKNPRLLLKDNLIEDVIIG